MPNNIVNPFGNDDTDDQIYGYESSRISNYITNLRNQLKTADAVYEYVQNANTLEPNFKKAVLQQLQTLVA